MLIKQENVATQCINTSYQALLFASINILLLTHTIAKITKYIYITKLTFTARYRASTSRGMFTDIIRDQTIIVLLYGSLASITAGSSLVGIRCNTRDIICSGN